VANPKRRGRLDGKVVIVTGAGSTPGPGMATGRATAIVCAREGAKIVVADIQADRAAETTAMIAEEGGVATTFVGDMTVAADCEAMVQAAVDTFGGLDALVNNIADTHRGNVVTTGETDRDRVLATSLRTTFLASKAAVPAMVRGGGGSIVNIGSIAATRGTGNAAYAAAKGGVHALTVDMAYSHGRQGIRVNAVAPGHITTPLMFSNLGVTPETQHRQEMAAASNLLGTEGTGWDVGWAAAFLASDEARWITGVTLPVDGGVLAVTPLLMAGALRAVEPPGSRRSAS
jgi:NAD(P)-dependent dehydrogenase (short-subunit alcohol dehydrogenase family)